MKKNNKKNFKGFKEANENQYRDFQESFEANPVKTRILTLIGGILGGVLAMCVLAFMKVIFFIVMVNIGACIAFVYRGAKYVEEKDDYRFARRMEREGYTQDGPNTWVKKEKKS